MRRLIAVLPLIATVVALVTACSGYSYSVRYRLTFSVEVDGETKTASSVINVAYYGSDSVGASGVRGYSSVNGVAPVIDMGRHGWLVAAMAEFGSEWHRRKTKYGLACSKPRSAAQLPAVFGLRAGDLVKLRNVRRELDQNNYPAFIWFPASEPYTMAKQLCPEEFDIVIGADVKFRSIEIEIAPDAPLRTQLGITAPWLDEIRVDQRQGVSFGGTFKPLLHIQLERPGVEK